MSTTEALKVAVQEAIDRRGQELIEVGTTILQHPEPGFREQQTSQLVARKFRDFGIPFEEGIALTGLKGMLETGNAGPTVAVMGELDSLKVLDHPHADPTTAAAHACGHHCQIAMMLAVGIGLKAAGVLPHPAGRGAPLALPAEEDIENAYRGQLPPGGGIKIFRGETEVFCLGAPG